MSLDSRKYTRAFTLLEILVAMVIFAIVSILANDGYQALARQSEHLDAYMQRVHAVQMTMIRFTQDFGQLEARPVRDPLGNTSLPALLATAQGESLVEFTRAGWSNPAGVQRPTLQRVAYRLTDNTLYRDYWPVLDRVLNSEPIKVPMLEHVRSVKLRFMNQNGQWQTEWPATTTLTIGQNVPSPLVSNVSSGSQLSDRPLAIEVTIELEDWGTLLRLIEVPS